MSNVVKFQKREYGVYLITYTVRGVKYSSYVAATSLQDAENVIRQIKETMTLEGYLWPMDEHIDPAPLW